MAPSKASVALLVGLVVCGGVLIGVSGTAAATATANMTLSKGPPPQNYNDYEAGWELCTWSGLTWTLTGQQLGYPTIVCTFDGSYFYTSMMSVSGSAQHNWAAFELTPGTHNFDVTYSTGWDGRAHEYIYGYKTGTLTIACNNVQQTVRFEVYQGRGTINFNGGAYQNWQTTSVTAGCRNGYAISVATVGQGFTFYQWAANYGAFANPTASSTTFYVDYRFVNKAVMVLDMGLSNWGGYIAANAGTTIDFGQVVGRFTLPTNPTYVTPPPFTPAMNVDGVWVGIGGSGPGLAMWQAGIELDVTNGGGVTFTPWYEEITANGMCCAPVYDQTHHPAAGDVIEVILTIDEVGRNHVTWSVQDITAGWTWAGGLDGFFPDTTTAEWIAEAPSSYTAPAGNFVFTVLSVTNSDWANPLGRTTGIDQRGCHLTPGLIAGTFTITIAGC